MTRQGWGGILRRIVAFVVAVAVMVVLGSAAHSFLVQRAWSIAAGSAASGPAAIPLADRISWAAHDLVGMIVPYAALTSIALLIAFLIAGVVGRFTHVRGVVFGLAGALALFTLFTVVRMALGTVGIFGARGTIGLAAQMAVGLIAGVLFAKLTAQSAR